MENQLPSWLLAAVTGAGMTAYADELVEARAAKPAEAPASNEPSASTH